MVKATITRGTAPRRGSSEWRAERRRLCETPIGMLVTAATLRLIEGPEGRKLYGGPVPARALRRTLALAASLEREASLWEVERRAERAAAQRARVARTKGLARVAA
jgi:hypothetical protein